MLVVLAQDDDADRRLFEVERQAFTPFSNATISRSSRPERP